MTKVKVTSVVILMGLVGLFSGCQDSQVLNPSDSIVAGVKGVSSPGTIVFGAGEFETTAGDPVYVEAGGTPVSGPAGGKCLEGGTWVNPANNSTHPQHTHCTISAGGGLITVEINFSVLANDVQAKSGNRNLNFQDVDEDTYIHYQIRQNRTIGEGIILATGSNGSEWSIDLSQVNGAGNWFSNNPYSLTAVNGSHEVQLSMSW